VNNYLENRTQPPTVEIDSPHADAELVSQILAVGRIEFGLQRLFSLDKTVKGFTGTGHNDADSSVIAESPDGFRSEFYLFLPTSVGPPNADRCSEVIWCSERLPKELKTAVLQLSDQEGSSLTNLLSGPVNVEALPLELQSIARQFLDNPLFVEPITVEAILHPHGPFQSPNKRAIATLANLEIVEVSQVARTYLWQLLSNHQFIETADRQENDSFIKLKTARDSINQQWESYLAEQSDLYADGVSRAFVERADIATTLSKLALDYLELVNYRLRRDAKVIEAEGLVELNSTKARGAELAKSMVKHTVLGDGEAITRLRKTFTQAPFSLGSIRSEGLLTLNTDFEAGIADHLTERLTAEHFRNKLDLREIARSLLSLHGVELTTQQLMDYDFSQLNQAELTHEQVATVLITEFIAGIATQNGLETHIPHDHNLAELLREQGLRIVNTYVFMGSHGDETMAGYHAIINQTTGRAEMCGDHATNMDFDLQQDNANADEVLGAAPDVKYENGVIASPSDTNIQSAGAAPELHSLNPRRVDGSIGQIIYTRYANNTESGEPGSRPAAVAYNSDDSQSSASTNISDNSRPTATSTRTSVGAFNNASDRSSISGNNQSHTRVRSTFARFAVTGNTRVSTDAQRPVRPITPRPSNTSRQSSGTSSTLRGITSVTLKRPETSIGASLQLALKHADEAVAAKTATATALDSAASATTKEFINVEHLPLINNTQANPAYTQVAPKATEASQASSALSTVRSVVVFKPQSDDHGKRTGITPQPGGLHRTGDSALSLQLDAPGYDRVINPFVDAGELQRFTDQLAA